MASLSPAAIRLTRMASDEVSPAVAATPGTAATAEIGRLNTLSIGKIPQSSHVPSRQVGTGDAVPAILLLRGREPMRQVGSLEFFGLTAQPGISTLDQGSFIGLRRFVVGRNIEH